MRRGLKKNKGAPKSLLRKAQMNLEMMVDARGVLEEAHAKKFLDMTVDSSKLLEMMSVTPLKAPVQRTTRIDSMGRVLRPGYEGVAIADADRAKPGFSNLEHRARMFKGEIEMTREMLEDNIEGDGFRNTVLRVLAKAIARDTEELVTQGDTNSDDETLAQFDGVIKQSKVNVVNAADAPITRGLLRDVLTTQPEIYRRDKGSLVYLTSPNAEIAYRDYLGDRMTLLGDAAIGATGAQPTRVGYANIPIEDIPLFPENLGDEGDQTCVMLCDPDMFDVGIWREITFESDKDIRKGTFYTVFSMRMDVLVLKNQAVTKAINVRVNR